jgi:uncharacterized protein YutD
MKNISINDNNYELIKEIKNGFVETDFQEKCTEYFNEFDYIVGDYAYNKLRLKGFLNPNSKNSKDINNIDNLDKYIEEQCAYGCKYFVLKKIEKSN